MRAWELEKIEPSSLCLLFARANGQLLQLDEDFKADKVTGDEYTEKRLKLKQTAGSLQEELARMGVVT